MLTPRTATIATLSRTPQTRSLPINLAPPRGAMSVRRSIPGTSNKRPTWRRRRRVVVLRIKSYLRILKHEIPSIFICSFPPFLRARPYPEISQPIHTLEHQTLTANVGRWRMQAQSD